MLPLKRAKVLIIDEYSMVRCDHIDFMDKAMREARKIDEPFGGIIVVFVGDPAQLPPVATEEDRKQLEQWGYEYPFDITQSDIWKN